MNLYNIHAHQCCDEDDDENVVVDFLNTYPNEFAQESQNYPDGFFTCGIHPWHSADGLGRMKQLEEIVRDKRVVGVGEIGLDKIQGPPLDIQLRTFEMQIEIANAVDKPIIIHCVKYWDELIAVYNRKRINKPWILHGFRGNKHQVEQLAKMGFCFSLGKYFNEESVEKIPIDRLFFETDTSDVYIQEIYQNVAKVKGVTLEFLTNVVEMNIKRTFFQ